jgi:hypothetical protein
MTALHVIERDSESPPKHHPAPQVVDREGLEFCINQTVLPLRLALMEETRNLPSSTLLQVMLLSPAAWSGI